MDNLSERYIERFLVTVKIGRKLYDVEVPTTQGIEAAKRRATTALMLSRRITSLDAVKVVAAEKIA